MSYTASTDHPYAGEHILTVKDSGKVVTFKHETRLENSATTVVNSVMLNYALSDSSRICLEPGSQAGKYKLIQKRFFDIDSDGVGSYLSKYIKFLADGSMESHPVVTNLDTTWEISVADNGDGSQSLMVDQSRFSIDEDADLNFVLTTDVSDVNSKFVLKELKGDVAGSIYESSALSLSESEFTNITVTIDPIARVLEYYKNGKLIDTSPLYPGEYSSLMQSVYVGRDPTDLLYRNDNSVKGVQVFAEKLSRNAIGSLAETRDFDVQSKGNWLNLSAKLRRQSPINGETDSTHTIELYKNGALIGTKDIQLDPSADFGSSSGEIRVGQNFKGKIGQVKTFAVPLQAIDMKITGQPDYIEEKALLRPIIKCSFDDTISVGKSINAKSLIVEVLEGDADLTTFDMVDANGVKLSQEAGSSFGNLVSGSKGQYTLESESEITKLEIVTAAHSSSSTLNLKISNKNSSSAHEQVFGTFVVPPGSSSVLDFSALNIVNNVSGIHGLLQIEPEFRDGLENAGATSDRKSLAMEKGQKYSFPGDKFTNYDLTEFIMSCWVNIPNGFDEKMVLFEKGNFSLSTLKNSDEDVDRTEVTVRLGSETFTSYLSENTMDEWVSIGVGISKKKGEVYMYFKTLDAVRNSSNVHEDILALAAGRLETFSVADSSLFDELNVQNDMVGYVPAEFPGDGPSLDNLTFAVGEAGSQVALQFMRHSHIPVRKTAAQISDGIWTHVAATYDGEKGVVKLYHDGELISTVDDYIKTDETAGDAPLEIGAYAGSTISGGVEIADVNVFDYVATATQIKSMSSTMTAAVTTAGPTESEKLLDRTIFKITPSDPNFGDAVGAGAITYDGHRGVIRGGVTYDGSTKSLNGFNSGDSYIFYSGLDLDYTDQPHSISIWIKMDNDQANLGSVYSKMFSFGEDYGKNDRVGVFEMNQADTWWGYYNNAFNWTTNGVQANKWHHYVFTYSGRGTSTNTVKVYVDGVQITISRVQGNDGKRLTLPKKSKLFLGSQYGNGGFAGCMGDMAIFSRKLENGEVATLYNAGRLNYPASGY